eukprot:scaffold15359_cov104-Isochrysis_galbana.AAC.1
MEGDRGARGVRVLEGGSPQISARTPTPFSEPRFFASSTLPLPKPLSLPTLSGRCLGALGEGCLRHYFPNVLAHAHPRMRGLARLLDYYHTNRSMLVSWLCALLQPVEVGFVTDAL